MEISGRNALAGASRSEPEPFTSREIDDLLRTRAFNELARRIDCMIEQERRNCETAADTDAWRRAQGALKALRTIQTLPRIMLDELTPKGPK